MKRQDRVRAQCALPRSARAAQPGQPHHAPEYTSLVSLESRKECLRARESDTEAARIAPLGTSRRRAAAAQRVAARSAVPQSHADRAERRAHTHAS